MGRRTEMSVRTALGAQRIRIIRQLLTESVLLAVLGGIAGLAVAYAGTRMLLALAFPGAQNVPIDAPLPASSLALPSSLARHRRPLRRRACVDRRPGRARRRPAHRHRAPPPAEPPAAALLVILQAALSLVLLVGAGSSPRASSKLESTDMKLDATNRYIIHFNPQAAGYRHHPGRSPLPHHRRRFHAIPGVVKVGISTYTPMEDNNWGNGVQIQGKPESTRAPPSLKPMPSTSIRSAPTSSAGRGIGAQDTSTAPAVAVVNQSFVKTFFDKARIPSATLRLPRAEVRGDFEIVGVVEDTAYTSVRWKDHSMYFVPMMQRPPATKARSNEDIGLYAGAIVIQTDRPMNDMESLVAAHARRHQSQPHHRQVPDLRPSRSPTASPKSA